MVKTTCTSKKEAIKLALKELGEKAKPADIVKWVEKNTDQGKVSENYAHITKSEIFKPAEKTDKDGYKSKSDAIRKGFEVVGIDSPAKVASWVNTNTRFYVTTNYVSALKTHKTKGRSPQSTKVTKASYVSTASPEFETIVAREIKSRGLDDVLDQVQRIGAIIEA